MTYKTMNRSIIAAAAFVSSTAFGTMPASAQPLPALHVDHNRLVDESGRPVVLEGVNIPGLEWSADGDRNLQSTDVAVREWHAQIVRVPLSEDRWFGKADGKTDGGAAYRALVRRVVDEGTKDGAYTILDLHWSTPGQWNVDIGQHKMPDDHSVFFWKSVSSEYGNKPYILFDLYNEPHDVTWDIWQYGGTVTDHRNKDQVDHTYHAVGMQTLLDTVRSTGARNVCIAGGLDWANDFKGLFTGHALKDHHGNGVIYAEHFYPFKGETVAAWGTRMADVSRVYPIIVSEFGSDPSGGMGMTGSEWVQAVLSVIHEQHLSFTAWCFHPSASPCLLQDWNYTPTEHFGVYVKDALAGQWPAGR